MRSGGNRHLRSGRAGSLRTRGSAPGAAGPACLARTAASRARRPGDSRPSELTHSVRITENLKESRHSDGERELRKVTGVSGNRPGRQSQKLRKKEVYF